MAIVTGTAGDDELFPDENSDTEILGLEGNDRLYAGFGFDTLDGGVGIDWADFGAYFNGSPVLPNGADVDLSGNQATAQLESGVVRYILENIENIRGTEFDDILSGDVGDNEIQGLEGDDTIFGRDGNDVIFAGDGDDSVSGGDGNDILYATSGNETLDGGSDIDLVSFGTRSGGIEIFDNGVTADLSAGQATALVEAQTFNYELQNVEDLEGSIFADRLTGDDGDNEIQGLEGNDVIFGLAGNDVLFSGPGDDGVFGGDGDDSLFAMTGNDTLNGGSGNDEVTFETFVEGEPVFPDGVTANLSDGSATAKVSDETYTSLLQNINNLTGSRGADVLTGDAGDNVLRGLEGDDTIKGGAGDDTITGGDGNDVALYDGGSAHFTIRYDFDAVDTFIEDRSGAEGTDTRGTNILRFSDRDFTLVADGDVALDNTVLTPASFTELVELYIAYFNRAPDAEGLTFWTLAFINGTSLDTAAEFFFDQPETRALYGTEIDPAGFVTSVYENVLGRGPDDTGEAFWVGALTDGTVTEGKFIRDFPQGARAEPAADADPGFVAQQNADRAFLDTKTDIGVNFGAILGMSNIENANSVMELFDGSAESLAAAQAATDDAYQSAVAGDGSGEFLIQLVGLVDNPFEAEIV